MKALVGAFNQEKALVGAFSMIVKTDCETDGSSIALLMVMPLPTRWNTTTSLCSVSSTKMVNINIDNSLAETLVTADCGHCRYLNEDKGRLIVKWTLPPAALVTAVCEVCS